MKQKKKTTYMLAFSLILSALTGLYALCCTHSLPLAQAATTLTQGDISELQKDVEQAGAAYDQAVSAVAQTNDAIVKNQTQLDQIEQSLPEAKTQAASALVLSYKMEQNSSGLLGFLLSADSFNSFLSNIQYLNSIQTRNNQALINLEKKQTELQQKKTELETQRITLEAQKENAATSLESAKKTREEAQRQAEQKAQEEAATQPQDSPQAQTVQTVDWSADKTAFVNQWASRIDSYLAGSPLAGKGSTFASAAWDFGIDPRFSPAISAVESSKGAVCAYPYNAWGWGDSSWSNWDEAIVAHVSGLARIYGANLTLSAAQKYCPVDPNSWYAHTLQEMNSI